MIVFLVWMNLIGITLLTRGVLLAEFGETVVAEVTRAEKVRQFRRSWNSPYELEYRFRAPGSEKWYTHSEPLTGSPSHVGVDRIAWEEARGSGRIDVVYVRFLPWVNHPVKRTPWQSVTFYMLMTMFMGAILLFYAPAARRSWTRFRRQWRRQRTRGDSGGWGGQSDTSRAARRPKLAPVVEIFRRRPPSRGAGGRRGSRRG